MFTTVLTLECVKWKLNYLDLAHDESYIAIIKRKNGSVGDSWRATSVSPLVYEDEFAVDGVPGDVLCGLHPDVCQAGLGDDVGVQAADGHQAAEVAALVVGFVVLVETHLRGWPAL